MGKSKKEEKSLYDIVKSCIIACVALILGLGLIFGCWFQVEEDEYALVHTFGKVEVAEKAGINFKIPYIQKVSKISKAAKALSIGYDMSTNESIPKESFMITEDFNLVNVDFYIEYCISDPIKYIYASEAPEIIVKNLAQSYIRDTVGTTDVDSVITTGKYEIQSRVKEALSKRLEEEDIGITLINAVIQDSEVPEGEVEQAFKAVETAKQNMDTALNNANADANKRIPEAKAKADKIIKDANATKEARIAEAEGQVARFNSLYEEYSKFPLVTKERMFYETIENVIGKMDVYITDGSTETLLPLESFSNFDLGSTSNVSTEAQ